MNSSRFRISTPIYYAAMAFLYLPLIYLVVQAFFVNPNDWHGGFTTKWIEQLLQSDNLWGPLGTSLMIAAGSATVAVAVGLCGAVALHRSEKGLSAISKALILLPLLLPEVVTGLSLLLFFLLLGVPLGWGTVVLAHAGFSATFAYFILLEQFRKLDRNLPEAAQDLGATPSQVFWKVYLPNVVPGVTGAWLLAFTLSFDDFLISFFTSGSSVTTLPLKIYSMMKLGVSPELNALSLVLVALSLVFVFGFVSKDHFTKEQSKRWAVRRD